MLENEDVVIRPAARQGRDGMAILGLNRYDVAGIRFADGEDGANPADDAADEEQDSESDEDAPEQDDGADDDEGFDGEFDPKRARALITKLRDQIKARDEGNKPKSSPDTAKLTDENLRLRVALRTGLDEDLADRLRGKTEDELVADAEKLIERLSPSKKLDDRTPRPKLRGGTKPDKEPELSSEDVVKLALGR